MSWLDLESLVEPVLIILHLITTNHPPSHMQVTYTYITCSHSGRNPRRCITGCNGVAWEPDLLMPLADRQGVLPSTRQLTDSSIVSKTILQLENRPSCLALSAPAARNSHQGYL